MAKKNQAIFRILLIAVLLVVPLLIMKVMGFDRYNADEFLIISVALLADVAVYIAYKFFLPRLSG